MRRAFPHSRLTCSLTRQTCGGQPTVSFRREPGIGIRSTALPRDAAPASCLTGGRTVHALAFPVRVPTHRPPESPSGASTVNRIAHAFVVAATVLAPTTLIAQRDSLAFAGLHWREIGPFRGGRSVA